MSKDAKERWVLLHCGEMELVGFTADPLDGPALRIKRLSRVGMNVQTQEIVVVPVSGYENKCYRDPIIFPRTGFLYACEPHDDLVEKADAAWSAILRPSRGLSVVQGGGGNGR